MIVKLAPLFTIVQCFLISLLRWVLFAFLLRRHFQQREQKSLCSRTTYRALARGKAHINNVIRREICNKASRRYAAGRRRRHLGPINPFLQPEFNRGHDSNLEICRWICFWRSVIYTPHIKPENCHTIEIVFVTFRCRCSCSCSSGWSKEDLCRQSNREPFSKHPVMDLHPSLPKLHLWVILIYFLNLFYNWTAFSGLLNCFVNTIPSMFSRQI